MTELVFPQDPILCRLTRGAAVESVHRGAWCVVNSAGSVLESAGEIEFPFYARSSIKCLQALPLLETGAAEHFGYDESDLALSIASHNGEAIHTERAAGILERLGLTEADLRCGAQAPTDSEVRFQLRRDQLRPTQLHHNCSGKHAGFLALATHLGADPVRYLDPESPGQVLVRSAIADLADVPLESLRPGIDGCSAPNYRLSLRALATAFARVSNPDGLEQKRRGFCQRMTQAAANHPDLIAGTRKRIDTDILRATGGRLFAKVGAEAVYAIGVRGKDLAFALKMDDGAYRGMFKVVLALCERLGLLQSHEREALAAWSDPRLLNDAGLEVGRMEVVLP